MYKWLAIWVGVVLFPLPAMAYIDPASGGFLYQLLFPILMAIMAGFVFLRDALKAFLYRLLGRKAPKPPPDDPSTPVS